MIYQIAEPEFRILGWLSHEQRARIDPATAEPIEADGCPMAQALGITITDGSDVAKALCVRGTPMMDVFHAAAAFLDWWDVHLTQAEMAAKRQQLTAALAELAGRP